MLTQSIFAQRVCMGVDRYAFEVKDIVGSIVDEE